MTAAHRTALPASTPLPRRHAVLSLHLGIYSGRSSPEKVSPAVASGTSGRTVPPLLFIGNVYVCVCVSVAD